VTPMTAFYLNAAAQDYSSKHRPVPVLMMKPWARARTAAIKITTAGATVPGGAALNTTVGQCSASGGKAPYTYSMNNSDGGNFSITAGGVIQTAKPPNLTVGPHTIAVGGLDASANAFTQSIVINVV